jgi:hypothetical protein
MNTLNSLNQLVTLLEQNIAKIGITLAGLMVVIYSIKILVTTDNSPAGRAERWGSLRTAFIVAFIIGGVTVFVQFFVNLGGMVK